MTWRIQYTRQAERAIDSLDPAVRRRILLGIDRLLLDPRTAPNAIALKGTDRYRLRVGDWRVIYSLFDDVMTVLVVDVDHRRNVYR